MPKYKVYVRGELDYEYEVEVDNEDAAGEKAEEMFAQEHQVLWSGIQWVDIEEIDDES